jgi:hypothetical protein
VIEDEDAVALEERVDEVARPRRARVPGSSDENDRNALATELMRDRVPVDLDRPHLFCAGL